MTTRDAKACGARKTRCRGRSASNAKPVAGAPISWGVCEVPGWGLQLPVDRVLDEMRQTGLGATELGAIGWLPTEPGGLRATLDAHELRAVGAFVPIVAHDPKVLDRISGWGWDPGIHPSPGAPVWRMDAFRDRFLGAYGSVRLAGTRAASSH